MGLDIIGKWRRLAAAGFVVCLVAACGGGGGTGPGGGGGGGGGVDGDYQLIGANNQTLPTTVTSNNICAPALFTGGSLTLHANGTFEMDVSYTNDHGAPDGFQDHGRYQQNGAHVLFTSEAWGDQFEAEFNGAVMITQYDFCSDNQGAELELDFAI